MNPGRQAGKLTFWRISFWTSVGRLENVSRDLEDRLGAIGEI